VAVHALLAQSPIILAPMEDASDRVRGDTG